jgi:hypothetical protein
MEINLHFPIYVHDIVANQAQGLTHTHLYKHIYMYISSEFVPLSFPCIGRNNKINKLPSTQLASVRFFNLATRFDLRGSSSGK